LQVIPKDRHPFVAPDHPVTGGFIPQDFHARPAVPAGMVSRALEVEKLWKYGVK
jgi:hypothetical protein